MSGQAPHDLLKRDFLLKLYFEDLEHLQKHIEGLSVRDKRATYRAMRNAENLPRRTDLFLPFIRCTTGEFGLLQLVKMR
jgi:hypothetical protein